MAALLAPAALAQVGGPVRGTLKDKDGKPLPDVQVQFVGTENGRKYNLKTNKKGEFVSIGIQLGTYDIAFLDKGQKIYSVNKFAVKLGDNILDVNLEEEQQAAQGAAAPPPGVSKEQLQQVVEAQKQAQAEAAAVKNLNDLLAQANAAEQAGNLEQAVSIMENAVQTDATRSVLWSRLAEYERALGLKATGEQGNTWSAKAVEHYQKAVETSNEKTPPPQIAAYYNNMGQAYGKMNKMDEATAAYQKAAELDPMGAAKYYFNIGAMLTNGGKIDEAIGAFDQAIAADPALADAYYWKGVNMVGKAKLDNGKMIAPEGTDQAFNKYLELQPEGQFAQPAKDMLASIGAQVQTSFGEGKPKQQPARKK
jgi:tetratricopeptide (TPR) repeat protein